MYPIIRMLRDHWAHRNATPIGVGDVHVTHVRCMPWDIDVFMEMNNGRILTLFDLGRFGLFRRLGVLDAMKRRKWIGTVAGTTIRYRRRITVFQKLELRSRVIGWDDRFTYIEQGFFRGGDCAAHAVIRTALTTGKGIIPTSEMAEALGMPSVSPTLPDWVQEWSAAEQNRPWPPMQGAEALQSRGMAA